MAYTITEDVSLPSKGLVYRNLGKGVNPDFKLRSMTTQEEMVRLAPTERPYKSICDIIDACVVGDGPGISCYDMCIGDYHYLVNKLRIVTYGNNYKISAFCPHCQSINNETLDLESMKLLEFDEAVVDNLEINLPVTGKLVKLKLQTPRALDNIQVKRKELLKENPDLEADPTILYTLSAVIDTVDGEILDKVRLDNFIRQLPMRDSNKILNAIRKINDKIGYDLALKFKCKSCGLDYNSTFRINNEFFGPTDDE